jgi:hypothetical protein
VPRAFGAVPWWLREPRHPPARVDDLSLAPGLATIASSVLVLGALASVTLLGWRRRRGDVLAAGALGLVLSAAVALLAASTPRETVQTVGYTLWWASPAGMWVWLALGWSLATLLRPVRRLATPPRPARTGLATLGLLAVVVAVASVVSVNATHPQEPYEEMRTVAERLRTEVPPGGTTRVDASSTRDAFFMMLRFYGGAVYSLRREGREVVAPLVAPGLDDQYDAEEGDRYSRVVRVDVDKPPPEQARLIARFAVREGSGGRRDAVGQEAPPKRVVAVTLMPGTTAP